MNITQQHILGKDESQLIDCQNGYKLLADVCAAFKSMQRAAQKDGFDLQIASSYRGFERQQTIWQNKWAGKTQILDIDEQALNIAELTEKQKAYAILTWSALPGASRHHWGTDLDVYDNKDFEKSGNKLQLVCSEYETGGPCYELSQWLTEHAKKFGFTRPYLNYRGGVAAEPWHLSYHAIADDIVKQLDIDTIAHSLQAEKIPGSDTILANLPDIFRRFILNEGES